MGKYSDELENSLRNAAWIGDAVLGLYLRQLLLCNNVQPAGIRSELFKHFSSNQFLNNFGRPTAMEAEIGDVYDQRGLAAAFIFIEEKYLPVIRKQIRNMPGSQGITLEIGIARAELTGVEVASSLWMIPPL